jgi:hypothetical protein
MNSIEKANFINHLRFNIKDSSKGFKYFLEKWGELKEEDADSLKEPILIMCVLEMQNDYSISSAYFEFQDVIKYFENDLKPNVNKFKIKQGIKDIEIVKLFQRLKALNHILSTNEETAALISLVFDIKFQTALSYLKKPSELDGVYDLL